MFDEILEVFDRGKRRRDADRDQPSRGMFDAFGADDEDERHRSLRDDDRRGDLSQDRHGRRDSALDWD